MRRNGQLSLEEAVRLFLDDRHSNNRAESTHDLYQRALDQFLNWLKRQDFGLGDLKPVVV